MLTNHRQRQAGRYARASYRLAAHEAQRNAELRRAVLAHLRAQNRLALEAELRRLELERGTPPRPDTNEAGP